MKQTEILFYLFIICMCIFFFLCFCLCCCCCCDYLWFYLFICACFFFSFTHIHNTRYHHLRLAERVAAHDWAEERAHRSGRLTSALHVLADNANGDCGLLRAALGSLQRAIESESSEKKGEKAEKDEQVENDEPVEKAEEGESVEKAEEGESVTLSGVMSELRSTAGETLFDVLARRHVHGTGEWFELFFEFAGAERHMVTRVSLFLSSSFYFFILFLLFISSFYFFFLFFLFISSFYFFFFSF